MSKEQQELLDEAYENYCKITPSEQVIGSDLNPLKNSMTWKRKTDYSSGYPIYERLTKEEFINKIKTDTEFSENWGLKIEERKLSTKERVDIFNLKMIKEGIRTQIPTVGVDESYWKESLEETKHNIPTKLITITYNDKTIESYE